MSEQAGLGAAVAFFRKKRRLTMGQLAQYSGLSSSYIQLLEKNKRGANVRHETLLKLARGLRVTEDDLLHFDPSNPPIPDVKVFRDTPPVAHGDPTNSSDRQLKIIKALSQLSNEQLMKLESFLDWLIERGE